MDLMLCIIEELSQKKEDALKDTATHEAVWRERLCNDSNNDADSIKQTLQSCEDDLMATKIKKYKQDTLDYIHCKVYKWVQIDEPQHPSTTSHHTKRSPPPPSWRRGKTTRAAGLNPVINLSDKVLTAINVLLRPKA